MSHDAREAAFVAGSTWQDDDCWVASIEVVGGYYIAALAYGSTKAEAEQRRSTILATLSPDPVLLGEVREWPDIGQDPLKAPRPDDRMAASVEHVRAAYVKQQPHVPDQTALVWRWHLGALLEAEIRLRTLLAKLPKLTGEEV